MNQPLKKIYNVRFKLRSPLHISAGDSKDGYSNTVKLFDKPLIPASSIKGKMRSNFRSLLSDKCCNGEEPEEEICSCPVCMIFGRKGYQPSRVILQNFYYEDEKTEKTFGMRSTVAIDRYRRVAQDGALAFTEVVDTGSFAGDIEIYFTNESLKYEEYFIASIRMIEAIGKGRSRGLGFVDVEVKAVE